MNSFENGNPNNFPKIPTPKDLWEIRQKEASGEISELRKKVISHLKASGGKEYWGGFDVGVYQDVARQFIRRELEAAGWVVSEHTDQLEGGTYWRIKPAEIDNNMNQKFL